MFDEWFYVLADEDNDCDSDYSSDYGSSYDEPSMTILLMTEGR